MIAVPRTGLARCEGSFAISAGIAGESAQFSEFTFERHVEAHQIHPDEIAFGDCFSEGCDLEIPWPDRIATLQHSRERRRSVVSTLPSQRRDPERQIGARKVRVDLDRALE